MKTPGCLCAFSSLGMAGFAAELELLEKENSVWMSDLSAVA